MIFGNGKADELKAVVCDKQVVYKQIYQLGEGVKIPQALFTFKRKEEKRLIRKRKFDKEKELIKRRKENI